MAFACLVVAWIFLQVADTLAPALLQFLEIDPDCARSHDKLHSWGYLRET
jgi:hypothetical protein